MKKLLVLTLFTVLTIACEKKTLIIQDLKMTVFLSDTTRVDTVYSNFKLCVGRKREIIFYAKDNVIVGLEPQSKENEIVFSLSINGNKKTRVITPRSLLDGLEYRINGKSALFSIQEDESVIIGFNAWNDRFLEFSSNQSGDDVLKLNLDKKCQ